MYYMIRWRGTRNKQRNGTYASCTRRLAYCAHTHTSIHSMREIFLHLALSILLNHTEMLSVAKNSILRDMETICQLCHIEEFRGRIALRMKMSPIRY